MSILRLKGLIVSRSGFFIFSIKLSLHIIVGIVSIAPVVSKCVQQAIEAIIWKLL